MAQSGLEWTREDLKCAKMAQGGLEWSRVTQRGQECTRVHQSGPEWLKVTKSGTRVDQSAPEVPRVDPKHAKLAKHCLQWPRMSHSGSECTRLHQKDTRVA